MFSKTVERAERLICLTNENPSWVSWRGSSSHGTARHLIDYQIITNNCCLQLLLFEIKLTFSWLIQLNLNAIPSSFVVVRVYPTQKWRARRNFQVSTTVAVDSQEARPQRIIIWTSCTSILESTRIYPSTSACLLLDSFEPPALTPSDSALFDRPSFRLGKEVDLLCPCSMDESQRKKERNKAER